MLIIRYGGKCVDCGYIGPPETFDFDHVRGTKIGSVSILLRGNRGIEESEKCDLVCANCHRIRTSVRSRTK